MTSPSQSADEATAHTIQDEDLERDRAAIGHDVADRAQEYLGTATPESIRNFAHSYGDDNPLYCDPGYGLTTHWSGQVAPSIMTGIVNASLRGDRLDSSLKGGRYRGIHVFASAFDWEFYRPLRPGDTVYAFHCLDSMEERDTKFAGHAVFRTTRWVKMNQDADIIGVHRMVGIYAERKAAGDRAKRTPPEPASYTDEDLAAIDARYAQEQRRGPVTRYWEDVEVGEALSPLMKGPITLTDIIRFHAGGYHINDLATSRLAWRNRLRKPGFYIKNDQGVPDVAQRVHWDADWARATGNPTTIDYGSMREFWLHHLLTDWIGDAGWVTSQRVEVRKFSYLGDAHRITGEVTAKRAEDGRFLVDIEMRATSQRDVPTAIGQATVALPSRDRGPVRLPTPDEALARQAATMMERHGELERGDDRGS